MTAAVIMEKGLAHYRPDTHVPSAESHQMGPIQVTRGARVPFLKR